jgi:hypothetical protein
MVFFLFCLDADLRKLGIEQLLAHDKVTLTLQVMLNL